MKPKGKVTEVLISRDQIARRVNELGAQISEDYHGQEIYAICLLKGSMIFTSDLIRHFNVPVVLDIMHATSYEGTESTGNVRVLYDLSRDISGADVLVIEDIIDTGRTLSYTLDLLRSRKPNSLKVCTLLDKPSRRIDPVDVGYVGFTIDDHFVVGYGLDYNEYYRDLPYIGIFNPEA